jgi:polar amino acid transport system substrate-binding protein
MSITPERAKVLYFAQPYYTTPAALFINKNNTTYDTLSLHDALPISTCRMCTLDWLNNRHFKFTQN